jgi:hypothetical protein
VEERWGDAMRGIYMHFSSWGEGKLEYGKKKIEQGV